MKRKFIKKWIFFFALLCFNLFMSLKTSFPSYYFLFWSLLALISISSIWLLLMFLAPKPHISRKFNLRIEEDDFLDIRLEIKNTSFLPVFDLVLEDYLACALPKERQKFIVFDFLGPNSFKKLQYRCLCPQRGKYHLGPINAYFFDPLGIFYFRVKYHVVSELYVYPRTFRIRKFPQLNKGSSPWMGIETSRVSGDDDEFYGVREYRRGDPIKRIHWMASARKNQLIVKEFQRQSFFRATLLFNLEKDDNFGQGKESVAEYTIKIAASVAKYLIDLGVSIELISHAGEVVHIPFNKGEAHLEEILKFLTIAQPESRITLLELFETFHRNVAEDSSLIVIMTDRNQVFLPAMLSLGVRNVSLIPVILNSGSFIKIEETTEKTVPVDISEKIKFNPISISCGENLEEKF